MTSYQRITTVGILYLGEMGAALADVLRANGLRVVSTTHGRSERTRAFASTAEVELLDDLQQVVDAAEILISTVTPHAARSLASTVLQHKPAFGTAFVDANSIAPRTAERIASDCAAVDVDFVDMAVRGLATSLVERGAVYLSGPQATSVASLLRPVEVEIVGRNAGAASQLKMMMSGISKGVAAQFMELGIAAQQAGILDRFLLGVKRYYPDVFSAMQSVLPTYPQHVGRRAQELAEVESCLNDLNLCSEVVAGGKRLFERIAATDLHTCTDSVRGASLADVIEMMAQKAPLRTESNPRPSPTGQLDSATVTHPLEAHAQ